MTVENFQAEVTRLITESAEMEKSLQAGQPEAETKSRLLEPFLNALGFTPECRTPEGSIRSLIRTTTWVDYLLKPAPKDRPVLMFEAKSLWDQDIWEKNKQQVLDYLRDYSLDIANDQPVLWIILSNFKEWYILRLQDRTPFWQFTITDLQNDPELSDRLYNCLARENLRGNKLEAYYSERTREGLGERFLADLKIWRAILANGIRLSQPQLSLEKTREASQVILNRFLLIRLLEAFSLQMPYNYLGRLYYNWQTTLPDLPFIEQLRNGFRHTWVGYNTELFHQSWVDELDISNEYLEPLIIMNAVPREGILYAITGSLTEYRSIYNYDFTTLTQDILGTAYEQFLAHQLIEEHGIIKILENQETRKQEGVFYTPDYIVSQIVYQTLQPLVEAKIDLAIALLETHNFSEAYQIASSVLEITVCDPACGSGSFLLGAFDYLLEELKRYNKACENPNLSSGNGDLFSHASAIPLNNLEENIVVKMLHGVDRDPQAVLLAKLSLWTKLLRTRPNLYGQKKNVHSRLPALTLNIRVGDSLIHSPANLESVKVELSKAADLARLARDIDLKESDRTVAVTNLELTISSINQQINPVLTAFFATEESLQSAVKLIKNREGSESELRAIRLYITTVESPKTLTDWTSSELERLRSELMIIPTALEDVVIKRPFNWQVEFPHVFDPQLPEKGFTAIVGNPPYFNVDATFGRGAPELLWLKTMYADIYTDKTDILFYFLRWSYELLKPQGSLGFITSRAFIQGDKSKNLRTFLTQNTTIISILDFLGHKVFKAGIATCIIQFKKELPTDENIIVANCILDFDQAKKIIRKRRALASLDQVSVKIEVVQKQLESSRWSISPYPEIFQIIDAAGTKLKDANICDVVEQGIQTGENTIFAPVKGFPKNFPRERLYQRITNSEIETNGFVVDGIYLLYIENGDDFNALPPSVKKYLNSNRSKLEERAAHKEGSCAWYALHRSRRKGEHSHFRPKILCPYRASSNRFSIDLEGCLAGLTDTTAIFLKDIYTFNSEDPKLDRLYFLTALLNSQVLEFRFRALGGLGKLTSRGMFEYFATQVGDLPIPDLAEDDLDFQTLAQLGKEAHQVWSDRYQIITTYQTKASSIPYHEVSAIHYHNISGDYGMDVEYASPNPNLEGHLLSLRLEAKTDGYTLWGEITEDRDWKEGDRYWLEIVTVKIRNPFLHRYLLARLTYLLEFDPEFRRKQKLNREFSNLLTSAFEVLKLYQFDGDRISNLRTLEVIEQRVIQEVGRSDLEDLLLRQVEIQTEINQIAYRLYGVEQYQNIIAQALKVVL
jgi:hypothetical protein